MPLGLGSEVLVTCFLFERIPPAVDPSALYTTEIHFQLTGENNEPVQGRAWFASRRLAHHHPNFLGFKLNLDPSARNSEFVGGQHDDRGMLPSSAIAEIVRAFYDRVTKVLDPSHESAPISVADTLAVRYRCGATGAWSRVQEERR